MWVYFSFASHVGHLSVFDNFGSDDAVLGLLHFELGLVELSLREGALLNGRELLLILGKEPKLAGHDLIRSQVGIEVSSKDYPELRQAILEKEKVFTELLYLDGIDCTLGAEVDTDEDIVISHQDGQLASPFPQLLLMGPILDLIDYVFEGSELLEGTFVDDDQGVLFGIDHYVNEAFILDCRKQFFRVLLDEEDIGMELDVPLAEADQFMLLIQEDLVVKVANFRVEDYRVILDGLFKATIGGTIAEYIQQQGVVENKIEQLAILDILLSPGAFFCLHALTQFPEVLIPLLLKLLPGHEVSSFRAYR